MDNLRFLSYQSMGTIWSITIWDKITNEDFDLWSNEIKNKSEIFDQTYSRFIKNSLVWDIASGPGVYSVPTDFIQMLNIYFSLYLPSDRKLNPLIGFTISDLGYDADYRLVPKEKIRVTPDLLETVEIISDSQIRVNKTVLFDFGALGKGYFVDQIYSFLVSKGLKHILVNGSGDIRYCGPTALRVGLEDPEDEKKVIGKILINEGGFCASGINRRVWDKYHHVIDPSQNSSVDGLLASWVWASTTVWADALASCLFFVPPEKISLIPFEYCLMNTERLIKKSADFTADFF